MTRIRTAFSLASRGAMALALVAFPLVAQQNGQGDTQAQIAAKREVLSKQTYVEPPAEIAKLITAPRHLNVTLSQPSPDRKRFLKEQSDGLPSVNTFGKMHYYLGGLSVDPKANRARQLTTRGSAGLQFVDALTGKSTPVETPKGATISSPSWSPDGKQVAYLANFETASHIFVADATTGKSVQVSKTPVLATLVTSLDWTADGKSVMAVLLPEGRQGEPKRPEIATGPQVRLWTDGVKARERNYWSLLQDPHEEALFEYYATGQLASIDVKTKTVKKIGSPAMIQSFDGSPDGQYFRVTTVQKPFSYVVQHSSFGASDEIWDTSGKMLAQVTKREIRFLVDTAGGGANARRDSTAKRSLAWMPQGAGIYYLEQVPQARRNEDSTAAGAGRGGRSGGGGQSRPDRVVQWSPPFGPSDTKVLYTNDGPVSEVIFSDDAKTLFIGSSSSGTGEIFAVNLDEPTRKYSLVRQRGYTPQFAGMGGGRFGGGGGRGGTDDSVAFYSNPGSLVTKRGTSGVQVAQVSSDGAVFFEGTKYHPTYLQNPPQPFVDKVDIKSGTKTRIFEGSRDAFEDVTAALDDDYTRAIVVRESKTQVADSYLRDLKSGQMTKLTSNTDYTPEFTSAVRKRIEVSRADGIRFVVNLTLPPGYQDGTRLPAMFWLYPYEYTDQAGYDRTLRTDNVNRFPQSGPRTIEYLVTQGYAVANFSPPVIGDAGRMNDNYVIDLQKNLYAVIDELDRLGYIDRTRLGIGGHSYGAFTTMNAMVHTPYFKAGIAGDGMYNRTLTPNGFQSERRDLWDGQQTYLEMSPMLYADQLQGAVLMYHSMEDQNVGTDLVSSVRMMQALRAHGKTASLYMYPYEDHGPATKETLLDQWARWTAWLDIYVKHAGEKPKVAATVQP
jgi:dipeptidyl aminopeptidase/acylaminoacyl peptidase